MGLALGGCDEDAGVEPRAEEASGEEEAEPAPADDPPAPDPSLGDPEAVRQAPVYGGPPVPPPTGLSDSAEATSSDPRGPQGPNE